MNTSVNAKNALKVKAQSLLTKKKVMYLLSTDNYTQFTIIIYKKKYYIYIFSVTIIIYNY